MFWLAAVCLAVLLWRLTAVSLFNASADRIYYGSDTRIDAIVFGCVLSAWCWRSRQRHKDGPGGSGILMLLGGIALLLASLLLRDAWFRDTWRYTLQGIAFMPLFYYSVHTPSWGLFRLLNQRWIKRLGVYSYVIYLIHLILLENLSPLLPGGALATMLTALAALAFSLAIAWAMHRYVERPLKRRRARYNPALTPQPEDTANDAPAATSHSAASTQPSLQPPPER